MKRVHLANRPTSLLSGLLTCGCCGGKVGIITPNRYACLNHHRRGTCENNRTITRQNIEARVLTGLKEKLVSSEAAQDAFAPLDFATDVATLRFEAQGAGQQDFTLTPALLRSELAGIVEQIFADGERQGFLLPAAAVLDEDQENGFLSLQNARVLISVET
nr:zinc ribbon domain-containing protein [Paracoccus sp. TRP]